jgi:hypothetical protein
MDRRSFIARLAGVVPGAMVFARRFKNMTRVSVSHDGAAPVSFTVVGLIAGTSDRPPVDYTAARPYRATTPAAFTAFVGAAPVVITAAGNSFIRVVADNDMPQQHLVGRAPRVTLRMHRSPPGAAQGPPMVELIGEAVPGK